MQNNPMLQEPNCYNIVFVRKITCLQACYLCLIIIINACTCNIVLKGTICKT